MWKQQLIHTKRGIFEIFIRGDGEPRCVTHHYSQFNKTGDYFAESFIHTHQVFLINLRDAGHSVKSGTEKELSMRETIEDLEVVKEALQLTKLYIYFI